MASSIEAGNLFSVKGLVVVVTGGGSGIGLMMAKALDANGAAKVFIVGRRKASLEAAAKEAVNGNIIPLVGDVSSKESLQAVAQHVASEVGFVNVLICNSGILGPSLTGLSEDPKPTLTELQEHFWKAPISDFTDTFNINTTGVFYTTVAFLNLLDAGNKKKNVYQKSQIIATSSIAGFNRMPTGGFAYGASKAATTHMMKSLASYLIPYDLRSNVIAPGLYPSELAAPLFEGRDATQEGSWPREMIPAMRAGAPEDIAGTVLFLCSRAGAYLDGNVVVTDGGRLSGYPATY
ncbi:hypothetical protein MMC12_005038 [Toensbergia leucococca]|nr:hypothetical protein [Toensbergia leucococca]